MSFLEALQAKRNKMKSCETIVTTATGERFKENTTTQEKKKLEQETNSNSYGFVIDTKPDFKPACILPNHLYFGSQDSVTLENILEYKLTHILSIGIECPLNDLPEGISNLFINCLDLPETELTSGVWDQAFEFIQNAMAKDGCVLVHCNAGVSRSASVVIAYLMKYQHMDFDMAYRYVKSRRECIQPNAGFLKQLRSFK
ncbi:dual specificity protein phosphatase 19 [Musca domestica]|uniref:Dual specificity protein phosphatase 19 n=1 Tax=Musca domestica TaxID=7370 RepID=A0A9J7I4X3_MUSDO|nr:dual specificity protein phosphatase 19 [Musca domestica]